MKKILRGLRGKNRPRKVPVGPQSVVPNPDMSDVRQALARIETALQAGIDVKDEVAWFAQRLVANVHWDPTTRIVLHLVERGDREAIRQVIPFLFGKSLDVAAFVLADVRREKIAGVPDDDKWLRERLERALSEAVRS